MVQGKSLQFGNLTGWAAAQRVFPSASVLATVVALFACGAGDSVPKGKPERESTAITRTTDTLQVHECIGVYQGINDDGDYSLLLLRKEDDSVAAFVFTADSILENSEKYAGKTLKVKYKPEELENPGSGKAFNAKYLLEIEIQD